MYLSVISCIYAFILMTSEYHAKRQHVQMSDLVLKKLCVTKSDVNTQTSPDIKKI